MTGTTFDVPAGLDSARPVLRAMAVREWLDRVWSEDLDRPGRGRLTARAESAVQPLSEWTAHGPAAVRDALALIAGLILQAADDQGLPTVREQVRACLPRWLEALQEQARRAAAGEPHAAYTGLLFLLGQLHDDAAAVTACADEALGATTPAAQALSAIFATATSRPQRSRFIHAYLGADACAGAFDGRLAHFESVLACPLCRARLDWQESQVACSTCGARYAWRGDIADLVPHDCSDPEEFPEALVDIYESQTRPRFVQVMGADWHGAVTPERELAYLQRFLQPVDGPVVDLACGAGSWTQRLAQWVGPTRVIGVDYSLAMLRACQGKLPHITLVRGSASRLPFADESLGGMNCSDALQALPDPAAALAEASRCLRPGAPLTVFTFREAQGPYAYFQHRFPASPRRLFQPDQIRAMADAVGMELVDMGGPEQSLFFTARKRS